MNVIEFEHVWKTYNLKRGRSLKSLLTDVLTKRHISQYPFYALQDVSFAIERGSLVGIIGQNGAGKTTILKLLSGITRPTQGHLRVEGRIGALINLGAGFHPELTGRENIYLYGSIMGLKRQDIAGHFDEIVEFAGLQEFIDVPVKRYSSGMFVRLGFSTAMHIEPDILLVDEVLAVGDLQFQQKALERIRKFITDGKAIIFVSHNLTMVQSLCHRVIWLDSGRIREEGEPRSVISHYITEMNQQAIQKTMKISESAIRPGTGEVRALRVELLDNRNLKTNIFEFGATLKIRIFYRVYKHVLFPEFRVGVHPGNHLMPLFSATSAERGRSLQEIEGNGWVEFIFESMPLLRSTLYYFNVHIFSHDGLIVYDRWDDALDFTVKLARPTGEDQHLLGKEGFFHVPFTYRHERSYDS